MGLLFFHFEKLGRPEPKTMQITPANLSTSPSRYVLATRRDFEIRQVDMLTPASIVRLLMPTTASVSISIDVLDVEVLAEEFGLRLVKIGANSPLLKLATRGDALLRGAMEIGDSIVAINGRRLARQPADLEALRIDPRICEICIFDHRTHQTVSWDLNAIDEQRRVEAID
jgi:hypothetical protein